jgi:hypothetical protein
MICIFVANGEGLCHDKANRMELNNCMESSIKELFSSWWARRNQPCKDTVF